MLRRRVPGFEEEDDHLSVALVAVGCGDDTSSGTGGSGTGGAGTGGSGTTPSTGGGGTPTGEDQAFEVLAYGDDSTVAAGKAKLRFIHASPDTPNVDVGLGSGDAFTPVFADVASSDAGTVAGMTFLQTDPLVDATVSARLKRARHSRIERDRRRRARRLRRHAVPPAPSPRSHARIPGRMWLGLPSRGLRRHGVRGAPLARRTSRERGTRGHPVGLGQRARRHAVGPRAWHGADVGRRLRAHRRQVRAGAALRLDV